MNKRACKKAYLKRTWTVGDGFAWPWKTQRYRRAVVLAMRRSWKAEFDRLNSQRVDRLLRSQEQERQQELADA